MYNHYSFIMQYSFSSYLYFLLSKLIFLYVFFFRFFESTELLLFGTYLVVTPDFIERMNGDLKAYVAVSLYAGFFTKHFLINYLANECRFGSSFSSMES